MINFEKHIKECLYEYDFFIVPGIGAFIASFSSASLTDDGQLIEPEKTFDFNHLLTEDAENKFISYVQSKENISKSEVAHQLKDFVFRLKTSLNSNTKQVIAQWISFRRDSEGQLIGNVDPKANFYRRPDFDDPFIQNSSESKASVIESTIPPVTDITEPEIDETPELEPVESVDHEEESVEIEEASEEESDQLEPDNEEAYEELTYEYEEQEGRSYGRLFMYLIPILLIAAALYYVLLKKPFNKTGAEISSNQEEVIPKDTLSEAMESEMDSMVAGENDLSTESVEPVEQQQKESTSQFVGTKRSESRKYPFEVAAGLFKSKTNADKLLEKMNKAGFNAEIRLVSGMRRVYVGVNTKEEAEALSKKIEEFTGEKSVYFDENGVSNK